MATDPFVSSKLEDKPRQEQNLAPGVHLPAARSWRANRPGELGPGQPEGSLLGSPGPNVGYALTLANRLADKWQLGAHERRDDAVAVVAELAMRRASAFGRAPVATDVEFASQILGYDAAPSLSEWREHVVHHAAHDYPTRRTVVDAVPDSVLRLAPAELSTRLATIRESLSSAFAAH
jgi:hypothetical protein